MVSTATAGRVASTNSRVLDDAVMRDLEHSQAGRGYPVDEPALDVPSDVTWQQHRYPSQPKLAHQRIVVPHFLPFPVGRRRMPDVQLNAADPHDVARSERAPRDASPVGSVPERLEQWIWRHRDALPDLARGEVANDRKCATGVIGITVRDCQVIEPAHTERPQRRRDDARTDIKRRATQETARVQQQRTRIRKSHQDGIRLADVKKRHDEPPVTPSRNEGTRRHEDAETAGGKAGHGRPPYDGSCALPPRGRAAKCPRAQPGDPGQVVHRHHPNPGRREPEREPSRGVNQPRRLDEAERPEMSGVPDAARGSPGQHPRRQGGHASHLRDGHQGDRDEVQREAGKGRAGEHEGRNGKERKLR
jgi:hypothetical protein